MSEQFQLHDLNPTPGSKKKAIRVGTRPGGKGGKTAGRGTKGLKARNTLRPGFEGGQTPMSMRIPKLKGFRNPNKETFAIINLDDSQPFPAGAVVTPDELRKRGFVKHHGRVKVLAEGEIDRALTVQADAFSAAAKSQDRSRRRDSGVSPLTRMACRCSATCSRSPIFGGRFSSRWRCLRSIASGTALPVPGIDLEAVRILQAQQQAGGIYGLLNLFSGGALEQFSVLARSGSCPTSPRRSSCRLLTVVIPRLQTLQEEGESVAR